MSDSLLGVIGAGSAPERRTSSSFRASWSCFSGSPAPIVMLARPPPIFVLMTGAESMTSSRMMAKRRPTFAPVTSSKRSAPAGLNVRQDVVAAEPLLLVLLDRGVGDVVARHVGAREEVHRAPPHLGRLAGVGVVAR